MFNIKRLIFNEILYYFKASNKNSVKLIKI